MEHKSEHIIKEVFELVKDNATIMEFVEMKCRANPKRLQLLRDILGEISYLEREQLLLKIYTYGSMLGSEDLLERQIFLWMIDMAEESERSTK